MIYLLGLLHPGLRLIINADLLLFIAYEAQMCFRTQVRVRVQVQV